MARSGTLRTLRAMSATTEPAAASAENKRRLNEALRRDLGDDPPAEPVGFCCECPSAGCFATVWATVGEYDELRRDPAKTLVAAEHEA